MSSAAASSKRGREDEQTIVLHNYWRSSCSWRVRLALAHKGLDYEYIVVNLLKGEHKAPHPYYEMNPAGVPTMEHREGGQTTTITQSHAIIEFLEERYPQAPLLPRSFADRANVRAVTLLIVSGIQPLHNLKVGKKVAEKAGEEGKKQFLLEVLDEGFAGLELMVKKHSTSGRYCVGDEFTMADVALIPQAYGARRFGVEPSDASKYPTVAKILAHLETLDVYKKTHPDEMPDAVKQ